MHIVMTGSDASALRVHAASDTRERLSRYAEELRSRRPDSDLTYVVIGGAEDADVNVGDGLRVVSVRGSRLLALLRLYTRLCREHRRNPIAALSTQSPDEEAWIALLFARPRAIPVIAQVHYDLFSPGLTEVRNPFRRMVRRLRRAVSLRAIAHCAAVRAVGAEFATALTDRGGMPPVHVIPVAVPDVDRPPRDPRQNVLFVGRLSAQKRLDLWLDVAAQVAAAVPQCRFEIVGDGPEGPALRRRVAAMPLRDRIDFAGALPPNEVARRYSRAAVLLLTSAYEGFGRVIVEAALARVPAVSTDISGPREIILDGVTGFLCRDTAADLAARVISLLRSPSLAETMGMAAQEHVARQFDIPTLTSQWVALLVDVAEGGVR